MTNAEKASRYDALMLVIRLSVNSLKAESGRLPSAFEVGNNLIKACDYGRKVEIDMMIPRLEAWINDGK